MTTSVYLAGKMRGIPFYNFPLFDEVRDALLARLYSVISPADLDREHGFDPHRDCPPDQNWHDIPAGFDMMHAIERDYQAIKRVDELCLLPGWQTSRGAIAERAIAEWMGKRVWEYVPSQLVVKRVVGLVGYATSGKDTAADGLLAVGNWQKVSFSDPLWQALLALNPYVPFEYVSTITRVGDCTPMPVPSSSYPLSELIRASGNDYVAVKRNPEVRRLLQRLGTEAGRDIHGQDCWLNIARRKIQEFNGNSVIVNVRFDNEADMIEREFGGVLVYVDRPGCGAVNEHKSDTHIPNLRKRCVAEIVNDGAPEELAMKLKTVIGL